MNPEIEKFWNDRGFQIVSSYPSPRIHTVAWRIIFYSKRNGVHADIVGMSRLFPGYLSCDEIEQIKCETYIFDNKSYTEEEFLKVMKMIAFA